MCQIIFFETTIKRGLNFLLENKEDIKKNLDLKGGDSYSFTLIYQNSKNKKFEYFNVQGKKFDLFDSFIEKLKNKKNEKSKAYFVLFSRQTPETEKENIRLPPYKKKVKGKTFLCWMHGIIANDKEIAKKHKTKFEVDSEAVCYDDEKEGLFTYLRFNIENGKFEIENEGMGLWKFFDLKNKLEIFATTQYLYLNGKKQKGIHVLKEKKNKKLFVSFSGGMDSILSTYKVVKNYNYEEIYLFYFDYGQISKEKEVEALKKFYFLLKKEGHKVYYKILDIKPIVDNFKKFYGKLKLTDKCSKGEEKETERNLAYVPFRNTLFLQLLVTIMDKNREEADLLVGLNLTEGQVYGDNNEAWLEGVKYVLSYGGNFFKKFILHAPYINRTKTNMIREFKDEFGIKKLKELLNISFSCYYPKNGKPCNKCGSCILRNKSIERALKT